MPPAGGARIYLACDEKPGIQAIENIALDLLPVPGGRPSFARHHEYKRHGTVSLLAGIDLLTGQVHSLVNDRHRSREFVEFLRLTSRRRPGIGSRLSPMAASSSPSCSSTVPG